MLSIETIAMICHEANRAYRQSIGDYSCSKWCELNSLDKDSKIAYIEQVLTRNITDIIISEYDDIIGTKLIIGITSQLANFAELELVNVNTTI